MAKFQTLAKTLLKKLSKYDTVYKQITQDNSDPLYPVNTTVELPITCYFKTPTVGDISSGIATSTDVMILVGGGDLVSIEPKENDTINDYTVKKIFKVIESNNEIALYKLVCEKR